MMNLFIRELKANRKSLLLWGIGIIFMVVAGMGKYESISGSGQSLNEIMQQMPKSLQAIMGTGSLDLSKAVDYYGVLFLYLVLMGSIHALMLGANIIAKEERDKTAEFLMVKPISRTGIVTAKLAAAAVHVILFNIMTFITSISAVAYYNKGTVPTGDIIILMVGMFILQLIFLFLGTGIAAASKHPKSAAALGTAILLLTFILSIMIDLNSKLEDLKYLTPFKYYEAKQMLADGALDPVFIVLSVVIIGVLFSVTYICFKRKDMNV
ncbi:MAG: ABC transporter permease subunit [Ectobacillus sp.]